MGTQAYELTPFSALVPAVPVIADPLDADQIRMSAEVKITGVTSEVLSTERARREAEAMLANCRGRIRRGERHAILDLLDANPVFIADPWVQETLVRLVEGGLPLRRPGRPRGRYRFHPLVVDGIVTHVKRSRQAKNTEQALVWFEEHGVMPYETAKALYYTVRRQDRFRPALIERPDLARRVSAAELSRLLPKVEVLDRDPVTRVVRDPLRGEVKITFTPL